MNFDPQQHEILRVLVGSTQHGTGEPGGEDTDLMAIAIEPPEQALGLQRWDTSQIRTQPEGVRSGPGDIDLSIYSLSKWCRLAAQGNPSILLPLFVSEDSPHFKQTDMGRRLRYSAHLFLSKEAGRRHLGYMRAQYERLMGERGGKHTNRPELVEKYGFDTKYAMHMLRLGVQGAELMLQRWVSLPMKDYWRQYLVDVRTGKYTLAEVLEAYAEVEQDLMLAIERSTLPNKANHAIISTFVAQCYMEQWLDVTLKVVKP